MLNGDDPRVFAMRSVVRARPWVFSRDPDSPAIREVLNAGGRATTVIDGWLSVLTPGADPDPLVELVDVPMTLAGLSRFNVENALAAASAALGVGLPREAVVEGLRSFGRDPAHNPGRMNFFTPRRRERGGRPGAQRGGARGAARDHAGRTPAGARPLLGLGAVGDRQDDIVRSLGEMGARDADVVVVAHKAKYLRGRTPEELDDLFRAGAARMGSRTCRRTPRRSRGWRRW